MPQWIRLSWPAATLHMRGKQHRKAGETRVTQEHKQHTHVHLTEKSEIWDWHWTGKLNGQVRKEHVKWFFFFFSNCRCTIQKHGCLLSDAFKEKLTYVDDVRQPGHEDLSVGVAHIRRTQWSVLKSPGLGMEWVISCLDSNKGTAKGRNLQLLTMWWKHYYYSWLLLDYCLLYDLPLNLCATRLRHGESLHYTIIWPRCLPR